MAELYIFDPDDTLITILSNEGEQACPFWDAPFREELNQGSSFQFTAQGDHPDSKHLKAENQVAFKDKDGDFRLFVIKEPERMDSEDGPVITCVCEPAMLELNDDMVYDENNAKEIYELAPKDVTLKTVVTRILKHTRWKVGEVAELGLNTTHFFYLNATEALMKAINTWGGEFRDRVTVEGSTITGRYIDILPRRGADTGKRWEMDKDILSIRHQVQSYPKTALIGRGAGIAQTDESGEETGGYSRKISFADVVWKKANGDPADKPKGQKWVGDLSALALFGRKDADGSRRHRIGIYETDTEDPNELLRETWEVLQSQKNQLSNFELDVFLLEEITGYEHEKVRLGDTSFSIDRRFAEPIEAEERVIVFEYDIASPDETGKVEMGQFIDLYADDRKLDEIEAIIKEKGPQWDNGGNKPITDDKIIDIIPAQPTNIKAAGGFKTVTVEWDFENYLYVANYEVYASQIQGFTPDISNLVYRGKTSMYSHFVNTNETWYFRVRGINTRGKAGPFSIEVTAETARIITDDILFGAVNAQILADLAVEAEKLAGQAVTAEKIANLAVGNAAIQNLAVTNGKISNLAVGTAQIQDLAISKAKIADLAVDTAKIADLAVTNAKIGSVSADKITAGTITGALLQTATSGKRVKIQEEDYAVFDGSLQKISLGFRQLSGGSIDAPRFAMGVKGMRTNSMGQDGSYFVATHYPRENNPMDNNISYMDFAYACTRTGAAVDEDRFSNLKFFDDGVIRLAPVKELEITTNYVNGSYDPNGEKTIATFGSSNSQYFNSHMGIGAVVNRTNANGLILGDDQREPFTRVRVQTDSVGDQYLRPLTESGSIQLGSPSFPFEHLFVVNGMSQTSGLDRKTDVTPVSISTESIVESNQKKVKDSDIIDFLENINIYSFVYKKNQDTKDGVRTIERTQEEVLEQGDLSYLQLGMIAEEIMKHPVSSYFMNGKEENGTLGVQAIPFISALILAYQQQNKRLKDIEEKMS